MHLGHVWEIVGKVFVSTCLEEINLLFSHVFLFFSWKNALMSFVGSLILALKVWQPVCHPAGPIELYKVL